MVYGFGVFIVILGVFFKIFYWELGFFNGGFFFVIGLIIEVIIFVILVFELVEDDLDWFLVYLELVGGKGKEKEVLKDV